MEPATIIGGATALLIAYPKARAGALQVAHDLEAAFTWLMKLRHRSTS